MLKLPLRFQVLQFYFSIQTIDLFQDLLPFTYELLILLASLHYFVCNPEAFRSWLGPIGLAQLHVNSGAGTSYQTTLSLPIRGFTKGMRTLDIGLELVKSH